MTEKAFQDYYPDNFSHCYGCGRLNKDGLQLKSYWDGAETVCHYKPRAYHTGGFPGLGYGGLIASLIDCHGTATASAAKYREEGRDMGSNPPLRFVTASLKIDFLAPTPIDQILEVRGKIKEIKGRKVIVTETLSAGEKICATGEVIAVLIPENYLAEK